jgi:hypothetical protein
MRVIGTVTFATAALSCSLGFAQDRLPSTPSSDYLNWDCAELTQEGRAVSRRGFVLSGLKAGLGGTDGTDTAPAIVIVWPATSPGGDTQRSEKLAAAFKQMDAIEEASIRSQCSIRFQRPPAS